MQSLPENAFAAGKVVPSDVAGQVAGFCGGWRGQLRARSDAAFDAWAKDVAAKFRREMEKPDPFVYLVIPDYSRKVEFDEQKNRLLNELGQVDILLTCSSGRHLWISLLRPELLAKTFADEALAEADKGRRAISYEDVTLREGYCGWPTVRDDFKELLGQYADAIKSALQERGCDGVTVEQSGFSIQLSATW